MQPGFMGPHIVKLASLSALVGIAMQGLTLGATLLAGGKPTFASAVVGAIAKMSWSTVVCIGVAVGLSVPRASYPSAGLWGFVSAQLGFHCARVVQHALGFALGQAVIAQPLRLLIGGSVIKGAQYAALALALMWLKRRTTAGAFRYVAYGLGLGLPFGSALVFLHVSVTGQRGAAQVLPMVINEVVFPVLCALVIFATTRAQRLVASSVDSSSGTEAVSTREGPRASKSTMEGR